MHRVLKVGRSATHPDRYFIERLDGLVWRMVCGEDHRPVCYGDPKQAIFMANAMDGGVYPEDITNIRLDNVNAFMIRS